MDTAIIITSAIIIGAIIFIILKKTVFKPKSVGERLNDLLKTLTVRVETEKHGIPVFGQKQFPKEFYAAIDDGFDYLLEVAAEKGYTQGLEPSKRAILVFPSERDYNSDGVYAPSFKVFIDKNDPYWGSQYDKGGYILAAEQVLNLEEDIHAVAEYTKNWNELALASFYGHEHEVLYKNDRQKYEETKTHLTGGHPITGYVPRPLKRMLATFVRSFKVRKNSIETGDVVHCKIEKDSSQQKLTLEKLNAS